MYVFGAVAIASGLLQGLPLLSAVTSQKRTKLIDIACSQLAQRFTLLQASIKQVILRYMMFI
jgi:hypothetical protein